MVHCCFRQEASLLGVCATLMACPSQVIFSWNVCQQQKYLHLDPITQDHLCWLVENVATTELVPLFTGYSRSRHVVLFVHRSVFSINTHSLILSLSSCNLQGAKWKGSLCGSCAHSQRNYAFCATLLLTFIVLNCFDGLKDKPHDIVYFVIVNTSHEQPKPAC